MRTPVRKWENRVVSKRSTFELDEKSATGKDESLEDSANLPDPDVIARKSSKTFRRRQGFGVISQAALAQFAEIANDLEKSK
jgi:hypothetical protein